jgi:O-methyltransferase involved in polyketide biosynthesis
VIVVAEGLIQYLSKDGAAAFFNRVTEQFPSGQVIFDVYSGLMTGIINFMVKLITFGKKPTSAGRTIFLPWGVDDPHELEKQVPRLRLISVVNFLTMPELVERLSVYANQRISYRLLGGRAWFRKAILHLRYEF